MDIQSMHTPDNREEFERRFNILYHQVVSGKMYFGPQAEKAVEGLLKLRKMKNGRLDMLTIDESARLQANMAVQFSDSVLDSLLKNTTDEE